MPFGRICASSRRAGTLNSAFNHARQNLKSRGAGCCRLKSAEEGAVNIGLQYQSFDSVIINRRSGTNWVNRSRTKIPVSFSFSRATGTGRDRPRSGAKCRAALPSCSLLVRGVNRLNGLRVGLAIPALSPSATCHDPKGSGEYSCKPLDLFMG